MAAGGVRKRFEALGRKGSSLCRGAGGIQAGAVGSVREMDCNTRHEKGGARGREGERREGERADEGQGQARGVGAEHENKGGKSAQGRATWEGGAWRWTETKRIAGHTADHRVYKRVEVPRDDHLQDVIMLSSSVRHDAVGNLPAKGVVPATTRNRF